MKPIALYLPQFHCFKENDEWWGEGYTEWTAVKAARPLYKGHIQPRYPYDDEYYDLSDKTAGRLKIQAELAKKYGIYGFSFYHYYFTGHKLMERPMEILLSHPEIDLRYFITWANETWTRAWYDKQDEVLLKQEYGNENEWKKHFEYLLPFFRDERYIKIDDKPVFCIYRTFDIKDLVSVRDTFEALAKEEGFPGIYLIGGKTAGEQDQRGICDAYYYFEPGYSLKHGLNMACTLKYDVMTAIRHGINLAFGKEILERRIPIDWIYDAVLGRDYACNEYPGIIARWDNTPRRGYKGLVYEGTTADKFYDTLCKLNSRIPKESFVFINAWNEWGEGAMLEADKAEGYAYLEAVKRAQEID
ncbi:MAG: glycoside hydrolase family 99-like domain-containing protein [Lachnospiraceae bacterium]|nr:glycoside hydrolase family 99-like domain-containing protein [Lachnospiraceae bacterium]